MAKDEQTQQHVQRRGNLIKWLAIVSVVVIIGAGGVVVILWLNHGKDVYAEAHAAYQEGDCGTALPLYAKLESFPSFAGDFVDNATSEQDECLAYEQAAHTAATEDNVDGIQAYETFLADYPSSPLTSLVLANISQHYLAWGDNLRQASDFTGAVSTFAQLAADYSEFEQQANEQILVTYLAWGEVLRTAEDFSTAVAVYKEMATDHPEFEQQANEQILATYLAWGEALRTAEDFSAAVAVYDELVDDYPTFGQQANEQILATYLAWGNALHLEGDFSEAIAVYDELGARGNTFADAALGPRNQTYLDWGTALTESGAYAKAEQVYRTLLSLEHERLAPLPLPVDAWPAVRPYPYGLAQTKINMLQDVMRSGPDDAYEPLSYVEASLSNRFCAIVGVSPDNAWYAMSIDTWTKAFADVDTMRDAVWQKQSTNRIAWVPADEVELALTGTYGIPLAGVFVHELAAKSEVAAQALTGLQATYAAWAEATLAAVDFDKAAAVYVAQAELSMDEPGRQDAWGQVAQTNLAAAEALAANGKYEASVAYTLQAEDFDISGEVVMLARTLRINNLLALGDQAADAREWEVAVGHYDDILTSERETFSSGWATVTQDRANLFAALDINSEPLQALEIGRQFPAVARHDDGERDWVLLLAPTAPAAQAWIFVEQITLTLPLTDLLAYDATSLPSLQSHTALVNLARTCQAWGQALHADGAYEEAIAHYQIILDDVDMRASITGTIDLVARAWTDWGDALTAQGKRAEAVHKYVNALAVAPESVAAAEASTTLSELMNDVAQAVAEGGDCEQVPVLDALAETTAEQQANQLLPQALFQCGQALLQSSAFSDAKTTYQRIIDEYPYSPYATRARRGLQEASWFATVKGSGIESAAGRVCNEAGDWVQAGFYTLTKPYVVYLHGRKWNQSLPSSWKGPDIETTVVVCVGDNDQYLVQRCPYTSNCAIERYRIFFPVRIVDPVARLTVTQGKIHGSMPSTCPFTEWFSGPGATKSYVGSTPDADDLMTWLKQYIP